MVYLGKYVDLFCSEDPGEIPIWALGAGMETRASSSEDSTCFVRLTSRRALAVPPSLPARGHPAGATSGANVTEFIGQYHEKQYFH